MYTKSGQANEDKSRAVAHATTADSKTHADQTFLDKRTESAAQRQAFSGSNTASRTQKPVQMQTSIAHTSQDFTFNTDKTDKVGTLMEAYLDPHDPVVGSATGTPQKALYDAVNKKTKSSMVRGHLLNHDLGGYGVAENLYPITSSANSKHKFYVENPVQKELDRAQDSKSKTDRNNNKGEGVYYKVQVGNLQLTDDNVAANPVSFICTAKKLTDIGKNSTGTLGDTLLNTTINSDTQGAKSADRGSAVKTGTDKEPSVKVTTKIVPSGWEHGGRSGKQDFDQLSGKKITLIDGDQVQSQNSTSTDTTSGGQAINIAIQELNENISEINSAKTELNILIQKLSGTQAQENLLNEFEYTFANYLLKMVGSQVEMYNKGVFSSNPLFHLQDMNDNVLWALDSMDNVINKYDT